MDHANVFLINKFSGSKREIRVPLDISAYELITAINYALSLHMDVALASECSLVCENPIAQLKGSELLKDFGVRNGTIIYYHNAV